MVFEWDRIDDNGNEDTFRAKVIGGWIVKAYRYGEGETAGSSSMVFVPDPHHNWKVK